MMWLMLQADQAEVGIDLTYKVRDFVVKTFKHVISFSRDGIDEKGYVVLCDDPKYQLEIGKEILSIDSKYFVIQRLIFKG